MLIICLQSPLSLQLLFRANFSVPCSFLLTPVYNYVFISNSLMHRSKKRRTVFRWDGIFKRRTILKRRTVCKKDLFYAKKCLRIRFYPIFQDLKGSGPYP
ncbi:hypothetical protein MSSIT_3285 [Methanosarcina siciliae T4/M]|uniref:Uncharacterized protein n=2 Tax=Methanosarcina siciliae TaxID=38027 RepID=A0A0E3PI97_9EURY|nr:hypothetical protein MSSIT_3285 [Methanosarcina siciliae T4/M]AKB33903.1 hypothetical protein MSSIH_3213 [Methanosarcina siciliae HI350]